MTAKRWLGVAAAAILAALAPTAAAQQQRQVRVGLAGPDLDACLSVAEVTGLNPRGDNFLAVRAAPAARGPILARLRAGHRVWVCDGTADDRWTGIVYEHDPRGDLDCDVGSPSPRIRPYSGRCRSGWVSARYITIIAG